MGMDPSNVWLWEGDIPLGAGPSSRESCGSDTEVDRLSAKCAEDLCGVWVSVFVFEGVRVYRVLKNGFERVAKGFWEGLERRVPVPKEFSLEKLWGQKLEGGR